MYTFALDVRGWYLRYGDVFQSENEERTFNVWPCRSKMPIPGPIP